MGTTVRPPSPGGPWKDGLCLALLLAVNVLLRRESLSCPLLNMDEAEYEAQAAYLLATGQSVFTLAPVHSYTVLVYRGLAGLFGPYCMPQVRLLVLGLAFLTAALVYLLVRRAAGRAAALFAGLTVLAYNPLAEGLSANREWFAVVPALLGLSLFLWEDRESPGWSWKVLAAGFVTGLALWFKEQAVYLAATVPLFLLGEGLARRRAAAPLRVAVLFALGGLLAGAAYLFPFALAGQLTAHLGRKLGFGLNYGNPDPAWQTLVGAARRYLLGFLPPGGYPSFFAVAYAAALVAFGRLARQAAGGRAAGPSLFDQRVVRLAAWYLLASMSAVRAGGYFWSHYYLFLVPPVALLNAFALQGVAAARALPGGPPPPTWRRAVLAAVLLLLLGALAVADRVGPGLALGAALGYLALLPVLLALRGGPRPRFDLSWVLGSALAMQLAYLGLGQTITHPRPARVGLLEQDEHVGRALRRLAGPGARLFVWGWNPSLYSYSLLEPATSFVTCAGVAGEFTPDGVPHPDEAQLTLLLGELEARPPDLFVDASAFTLSVEKVPGVYRLDHYPRLREFLRARYRAVGALAGYGVYARR